MKGVLNVGLPVFAIVLVGYVLGRSGSRRTVARGLWRFGVRHLCPDDLCGRGDVRPSDGGDDDFSRSSAGTLVFIQAVRYPLLVGQVSAVFLISTVLSARILPARIVFSGRLGAV